MDAVVAEPRAGREAQAVDPAHVAELAPAEVVDVVVLDQVVMGGRGGVSPTPADRDARVEEVADLVVVDLVVRASADPDADARVVDVAAVVDEAVVDLVPLGLQLGLAWAGPFRRAARRRRPGRGCGTARRGCPCSRAGARGRIRRCGRSRSARSVQCRAPRA